MHLLFTIAKYLPKSISGRKELQILECQNHSSLRLSFLSFCADSKLYHAERSTRRNTYPLNDEILFLDRWEEHIISGDEFYNPNLTHINRNFRIAPHPSDIPTISLLKEIFYFRDDLKKQIPDYNIEKMTDWAATKGS